MDEPGGRYAKWNKPDRERQIPHGIPLICGILKKIEIINRVENWVARARGLGIGRGW